MRLPYQGTSSQSVGPASPLYAHWLGACRSGIRLHVLRQCGIAIVSISALQPLRDTYESSVAARAHLGQGLDRAARRRKNASGSEPQYKPSSHGTPEQVS